MLNPIDNFNFTISKAVHEDMQGIFNLVSELALFEKEPQSVVTSPKIFLQDWSKGWFDAFVAKSSNGDIVGLAMFHPAYSSWRGKMLYLDDLIVTQAHRGAGIGNELLLKLIEEAGKMNATCCKWQVLDWNTSAIEFYDKIGAHFDKGWWNVRLDIS